MQMRCCSSQPSTPPSPRMGLCVRLPASPRRCILRLTQLCPILSKAGQSSTPPLPQEASLWSVGPPPPWRLAHVTRGTRSSFVTDTEGSWEPSHSGLASQDPAQTQHPSGMAGDLGQQSSCEDTPGVVVTSNPVQASRGNPTQPNFLVRVVLQYQCSPNPRLSSHSCYLWVIEAWWCPLFSDHHKKVECVSPPALF